MFSYIILLFVLSFIINNEFMVVIAQQQQDPTTLNGGSVLAMAGDGCVAIAMDKRFGSGPQMVNIAKRHVLIPHPLLMVSFTGLEGDIQSLSEELSVQVSSKIGRSIGFMSSRRKHHSKQISPKAMSSLTSHILYGRKQSPYYVEPVIAGLIKKKKEKVDSIKPTIQAEAEIIQTSPTIERNHHEVDRLIQAKGADNKFTEDDVYEYEPFICTYDVIGAKSTSKEFVCSGVASKSIYGIAEAMYKSKMNSKELVSICGKSFLSALERDCLSGYGAVIYLITRDGIVEYDLVCRND